MSTLANIIASLANPAPTLLDPEDYTNAETIAKVEDFKEEEEESNTVSELRIKTAPLLEDIDPEYTGKKISRKSLGPAFLDDKEIATIASKNDDELENSGESENSDLDEDEASDDELSDSDLAKFKTSFKTQILSDVEESKDEQDSEEIKDEQESEESKDEQESEESEISDVEESDDMVNKFSNIDMSSEIEKGQAVKDQQELFNKLCECRIKLQKLLTIANKLPQTSCWKILKQKGGKDIAEWMNKSSTSTKLLLNHCLNLQTELLKRNLEASIDQSENKEPIADNEEIPSDTDEEMEETDQAEKSKTERKHLKRKLTCEEYGNILTKRHKSLIAYRNSVIQKFYEKTRLASGRVTQKSFSALDSSPLQQIEQILQDESRLIKRTQLKRSIYKVLGKPDIPAVTSEEKTETSENTSKQDMLLKDYDPEIFDDDDFYRQFLKDVIESKSVGINPAILRKQMEIQSVRNKMKKKVDTKASKGRKIRYDVHPKLVNYMAPVETSTISDEARDNLLKCIFGRSSS